MCRRCVLPRPEVIFMGRLMAHFYDRMMRKSEEACLLEWRRGLLEPVHGRVLEVGAGTGVSLPLYPTAVTRVVMSEPDAPMRAKLSERLEHGANPQVEMSDGSLDALPFPDGSFDFVTCMLVLCSVPDLQRAVGEIRRVLVPGGRLVFMEHVAAEARPDRLKWQRRLEPLWKRISGNCHLTRSTEQAILNSGFAMESIERESMRKAMPIVRPCIRGHAVKQP
jgi:ubiquinone/menaquinone biosynthesis C-methylase UbiE